jgi:hypothetical protein
MTSPLEDLLNGSIPNGFAPSLTDTLKIKFITTLAAIGKFAQENPEDIKAIQSTILVAGSQIAAYGSARKIQPIVAKLIAGERISRKESRILYGRIGNLVAATVATGYLSLQHAKRLDDYNNKS